MKIGVLGFEPTLDGKVDFFEIDFSSDGFDPVKKSKVLINLNQYFYRHPNPIPIDERIEMIESKVRLPQTLGFSIKLTPRFFETHEIEREVLPLKKRLENSLSLPVFIDLPKNSPHLSKSHSSFSIDPLWVKPSRGGYWKVHGWHDTRWVRKYSQEELSKLSKLTQRYEPQLLTFAHSQRREQFFEFLSLQLEKTQIALSEFEIVLKSSLDRVHYSSCLHPSH